MVGDVQRNNLRFASKANAVTCRLSTVDRKVLEDQGENGGNERFRNFFNIDRLINRKRTRSTELGMTARLG